jgi:anti-anti-sigma factor
MAFLMVNDCGDCVEDESPAVLTLASHHREDAVVIEVLGEIDLATAPLLERAVAETLDGQDHDDLATVVDLHGVEFMGSTGLSLLLKAKEALESAGRSLRLARPSSTVMRTLELAGVTSIFAIDHLRPDDLDDDIGDVTMA